MDERMMLSQWMNQTVIFVVGLRCDTNSAARMRRTIGASSFCFFIVLFFFIYLAWRVSLSSTSSPAAAGNLREQAPWPNRTEPSRPRAARVSNWEVLGARPIVHPAASGVFLQNKGNVGVSSEGKITFVIVVSCATESTSQVDVTIWTGQNFKITFGSAVNQQNIVIGYAKNETQELAKWVKK